MADYNLTKYKKEIRTIDYCWDKGNQMESLDAENCLIKFLNIHTTFSIC